MKITKLIESDLVALVRLYKQFWNEDSSLEKMESTFQKISNDPHYIFLAAKENGVLIGTIMGVICEELYGECRPFMVVEDFIVDEDHRRKGIGTLLMRAMEKHAKDNNCCHILLITDTEREDAQGFYNSLGYTCEAYKGFKKRFKNG